MTKINKEFALSIFKREINYLKDAIDNSKNPFHFFYFSTLNNDNPELRTIVLRNIEFDPIKLFFNTDIRSKKIVHLKKNKYCSALFYDNRRRIQLRINCKATICHNNEFTKKNWDKTPLQSRKCYMAPYAPGVELSKWEPNLPTKYLKCDPKENDSMEGYKNFSIVNLEAKRFEIIELHYDGHIRFKLNKNLEDIIFLSS